MEYQILYAETIDALQHKVNGLLRDSWEPVGGLCVTQGVFYQAMVRG